MRVREPPSSQKTMLAPTPSASFGAERSIDIELVPTLRRFDPTVQWLFTSGCHALLLLTTCSIHACDDHLASLDFISRMLLQAPKGADITTHESFGSFRWSGFLWCVISFLTCQIFHRVIKREAFLRRRLRWVPRPRRRVQPVLARGDTQDVWRDFP